MTLLLEPDLSSYSDEKYEADLRRLPPQRYEKAMTYRFLADRKRCVRAYMLLWEGSPGNTAWRKRRCLTSAVMASPFCAIIPLCISV